MSFMFIFLFIHNYTYNIIIYHFLAISYSILIRVLGYNPIFYNMNYIMCIIFIYVNTEIGVKKNTYVINE